LHIWDTGYPSTIPLFHSLDGTRSEEYIARVEPSASDGGMKAELLLNEVHNNAADNSQRAEAPMISLIDRST
jgi:hypothetical protein